MKRRAKLSVAMIARDAEDQIGKALDSVTWADQICVADTGSRDRTKDVGEGHGASVKSIDFSSGFGKAKQEAVAMTSNDWVLSLDSDEVVTLELKGSIEKFLLECDDYVGAEVSRLTNLCGHWIHYSGWYPEYVLRLFHKKHAEFDENPLHESIKYNGKIKRLSGDLLHYSYPNLAVYVRKTKEYARWGAMQKIQLPILIKLFYMLIKPPIAFTRKFLLQRGFMDGLPGLWIAGFTAAGQFLKYYYALRRK